MGLKTLWENIRYRFNVYALKAMDYVNDKRVCGISLVKYVPSVFRNDAEKEGFTGSQSTHYIILERIFKHVPLCATDNFIDIGCGKGRVLAFLKKIKAPCQRIDGIEINEKAGKFAQKWAKRYDNVHIVIDDAFKHSYDTYSVLFLGRPFLPKTFLQFIEKLEKDITHPITFVYWVDQQSGYMLLDRPGWKLVGREKVLKMNGWQVCLSPQGYSVWHYTPANDQKP